jgi:SAM-dependent methyltransferase
MDIPAGNVLVVTMSMVEPVQPAQDAVLTEFGAALVEWAGVRPGDRVLDFGAGAGAVTAPALRRVGPTGHVVAADVAAELGELHQLADSTRLRTISLDTAGVTLAADAYDVVLCGFGLHVMNRPAQVLAEAFRVLKPGGTLAFSVPGPCADGGWWDHFAALAQEYRRRVTIPADVGLPLTELAGSLGFVAPQREARELHLPVAGPFAYWEWLLAHGNRWLYEALPPAERAEFRGRVLRALARRHPTRGRSVDVGAWLCRVRKPD